VSTVSSTFCRPALAPYYGQRVDVYASIDSIGWTGQHHRLAHQAPTRTLNITNVEVGGVGLDLDCLWVLLCPTASTRLERLIGAGARPSEARFSGTVLSYTSTTGPSYCIERVGELQVLHGADQWQSLNRKVSHPWGAGREREIERELDTIQTQRRRREQAAGVASFARQPLRQKADRAIVQQYFVRGEALSERQYQHVLRLVG
jgi:hypothetical protein